ncbi:ABC transporter ATP-binding protein [Paenibacillus aceris]|uniref:ATP-binding cassette subfamily B protein n=1 Tax=Paenibacillus aceris TaxID=869555 RepID=A0ABS4I043_9BACL|nr:ABC transporter ATP-binding protein [Paenibacillus aceris]MBP1964292.1 ATP-binding cassette subfamily B protein [Paenibacillus aceris]NHW36613.1 ABC transporter ATP-binding protein [Paenibacillus aceris]
MGFMKKYVSKHWKLFLVAVFFVTLEAFADLLQPTIMSHILDVGVAEKRLDYVLRMGGLMLIITALGAVAASLRNIVASHVSQKFGTELRADLFEKIQSLSFTNIEQFERASLITRLTNDVTQVQNFVNGLMRIFVKAPLLCIGSLIMAVRLNPHLAVVLLVVVPIVGVLVALNLKVGFARFVGVQKALDGVNRVMREYLSGVRVVKAFNRFDHEADKFQQANTDYQYQSIQVTRLLAIFNPSILLTVNFGIVAVLWLGASRVNHQQMQVGHIVAFVNYMTQILFALMTISMVFNMFVRAKASSNRIGEVFSQVDGMTWDDAAKLPAHRPGGRIDFENVTFSYEGASGEPNLKNINLSCLPGETIGIIGSTGSGKSSLVSLVPRFYDPSSGTIIVDGVDIRLLDPAKLRDRIAIVPQKTVLFSGTIEENLRWGNENATRDEIAHAANMAEADSFITAFPEGYETKLGQRGVNLSGGQKQRLSIARALVRKPDILILDDCTSALDTATETKIKQSLKQFASGVTCLIIAQRITSVMDADKIVVMDDGEIVGIGTHEMLMKNCRVYVEIFQSQFGKELPHHVKAE